MGFTSTLLLGTILGSGTGLANDCGALQGLAVPGVTITSATPVDAGFVPPGLSSDTSVSGPFCRVIAVASPVPQSTINFEVWLPSSTSWNSKFRGEGSGGWRAPSTTAPWWMR